MATPAKGTDIETLRNWFDIGYEVYKASRIEADEMWELYDNNQYTQEQLTELENRGQPKETYNIIKRYARMLLGFYENTVNTVVADPMSPEDVTTSVVLTDIISHDFDFNDMESKGSQIKLAGIISGLMSAHITVEETGERDRFNRPINQVIINYIPEEELILDPLSRNPDYSDARWIHRFKWIHRDDFIGLFGEAKLGMIDTYENSTEIPEAEFEYKYNQQFQGRFKREEYYLIINTVIEDMNFKNRRRWSIWWSGDIELKRSEVTFNNVKFPYLIQKVNSTKHTAYYGVFREVKESQHAINQAILKIQLMANTQKIFVEDSAVENISQFETAVNRVNAIIPVKSLAGIRVENLSRDVLEQYAVVDKAIERIQNVLNITDSFLGQAFASDSGRKVKLQQNTTTMALSYLTKRIEGFYRQLGRANAELAKQFYVAEQILPITDNVTGTRFLALNSPIMQPVIDENGKPTLDENGEMLQEPVLIEQVDPNTGKPILDKNGSLILAPIPTSQTDVAYNRSNIRIRAANFNDQDEQSQLMMETVLAGPVGQMIAQVDPAEYLTMSKLTVLSFKSKYAIEYAESIDRTIAKLGGDPNLLETVRLTAQSLPSSSPKSRTLKLPQNTNEETV